MTLRLLRHLMKLHVTKTYVDAQDELKYDKTGGDITGTVRINAQTNDDNTLGSYMRDMAR